MNDVLSVARPAGIRGGRGVDVTMRQTLEAAQERLSATFRPKPRAEAMVRHNSGVTLRLLGEPRLAEPTAAGGGPANRSRPRSQKTP